MANQSKDNGVQVGDRINYIYGFPGEEKTEKAKIKDATPESILLGFSDGDEMWHRRDSKWIKNTD